MERIFCGVRGLFCVCLAVAAVLVLGQCGWAAALTLAACAWALWKKPLPHFTAWLFAGGLLLRVVILLLLHPPIISDFELLLWAARGVLSGDHSYLNTEYFALWGYQFGIVSWEAFWLMLWDNPLILKLVNAGLGAATACLLYRFAREWAGERPAQLASFLLAASPFCSTLHTLLSNQIPSAFFLTLGLWVLACGDCKRLGFWRFPLAGLALQAGNILRSEGIIFLVAIFAWAVFRVLHEKAEFRRLAAGLAVLLVVYCGVHACTDAAIRAADINPYGLENRNPMWKVVTGLNFDSKGGYSSQDWYAVIAHLDENHQMTETSHAEQRWLIRSRLSSGPAALLAHLHNKIEFLWIDDALHWMFDHLEEYHPLLVSWARELERGLFFLAFGLAGYGFFGNWKRWEKLGFSAYLPYFIFFAAFCAFVLIEVQPRYAFLPQLYIYTAAALGLERLEGKLKDA